jgi:hypothetical protein
VTRVCSICTHEDRSEIERALVYRTPYRHIAARYEVSTGALVRHTRQHLPELLAKGQEAEQLASADKLLMDMKKLQANTLSMLYQARDAGDLRTALLAVERARKNIELLLGTEGRLDRRAQVNIHLHPEYVAVRTLIVEVLESFPAARNAVVRALEAAGNGRG